MYFTFQGSTASIFGKGIDLFWGTLYSLPLMMVVLLTIITLVLIYKPASIQERGSVATSKFCLVIFEISIILSIIGGLYLYSFSDSPRGDYGGIIVVYLYYLGLGAWAIIFGFLSSWYSARDINISFQNKRKIILTIGTIMIYLPLALPYILRLLS